MQIVYVYACVCVRVCGRVHACKYIYICILIIYIYTWMFVCVCACVHENLWYKFITTDKDSLPIAITDFVSCLISGNVERAENISTLDCVPGLLLSKLCTFILKQAFVLLMWYFMLRHNILSSSFNYSVVIIARNSNFIKLFATLISPSRVSRHRHFYI